MAATRVGTAAKKRLHALGVWLETTSSAKLRWSIRFLRSAHILLGIKWALTRDQAR